MYIHSKITAIRNFILEILMDIDRLAASLKSQVVQGLQLLPNTKVGVTAHSSVKEYRLSCVAVGALILNIFTLLGARFFEGGFGFKSLLLMLLRQLSGFEWYRCDCSLSFFLPF